MTACSHYSNTARWWQLLKMLQLYACYRPTSYLEHAKTTENDRDNREQPRQQRTTECKQWVSPLPTSSVKSLHWRFVKLDRSTIDRRVYRDYRKLPSTAPQRIHHTSMCHRWIVLGEMHRIAFHLMLSSCVCVCVCMCVSVCVCVCVCPVCGAQGNGLR